MAAIFRLDRLVRRLFRLQPRHLLAVEPVALGGGVDLGLVAAPFLGEHRPRFGVGAVMGHGMDQLAHAAIACFKVSDATRQRCAYSAEVRNSASRG